MESSLQQLVDEGEYRKAADYLDAKGALSNSERLRRIELEHHLGDPRRALEHAETLLSERLDRINRIEALAIIGRCHGWLGSPELGIPLLKKVIGMASEEAPFLEADLRARYAQDVLSWIGVEPALAELPRLRQAALKSGNQQALSRYHITRANIGALRGSLDFAHTELDHASELLTNKPHAEISWLVKHFRGGLASMDGRLEEARLAAEETVRLARESGVKSRVAYALGNLANVLAAEGNFASARQTLEESLSALRPSSRARLAALNTGIHIGLAINDQQFASRMVEEGLETLTRLGGDWWYYRLWFELNRVRWLIHKRDFDKAIELAAAALGPVARLADKELYERFNLLTAEAYARKGLLREANRFFRDGYSDSQRPTVPFLIELHRVAGVVTSASDRNEAQRQMNCAVRLASTAGLLGATPELDQTAAAIGIQLAEPTDRRPSGSEMLTRLRVILALGRHPLLLAREILNLLHGIGGLDSARVVQEKNGCTTPMHSIGGGGSSRGVGDESRIHLGKQSGTSYWLHVDGPLNAPQHLAIGAIKSIVTAALATNDQERPLLDGSLSSFGEGVLDSGMIVAAKESAELVATTRKLAPSNITVLLTGGAGDGD